MFREVVYTLLVSLILGFRVTDFSKVCEIRHRPFNLMFLWIFVTYTAQLVYIKNLKMFSCSTCVFNRH